MLNHLDPTQCAIVAGTLLLPVAFFHAYRAIKGALQPLVSGLRNIPGPASNSLLLGHVMEIFKAPEMSMNEAWLDKYGPVTRYRIALGVCQIIIACLLHIFQTTLLP